jgi:RNA polymerase sigma factor (sigma-70 family)
VRTLRRSTDPKYDWRKNTDKTLYERFEDNIGLADFVIRRFFPEHIGNEDFYQEACLALWNAVQKYDPTLNVRFSPFATRIIKNLLINYLLSKACKKRPIVPMPDDDELADYEQSLYLEDVAFLSDLTGDSAELARDLCDGKTSTQTCAERGWSQYHYALLKRDLRSEFKRRYNKP